MWRMSCVYVCTKRKQKWRNKSTPEHGQFVSYEYFIGHVLSPLQGDISNYHPVLPYVICWKKHRSIWTECSLFLCFLFLFCFLIMAMCSFCFDFNEGTYLKAMPICINIISVSLYLYIYLVVIRNYALIRSWNKPVLKNEL